MTTSPLPAAQVRRSRPSPGQATGPAATSARDVLMDGIDYLMGTAQLAPSPTDRRPWRFRARLGRLELLAARHPGGPLSLVGHDVDRQDVIACGAALFNLRLAAGHLGVDPVVTLLPDPSDPGLLARLAPGRLGEPRPDEEDLLAALARRRTRRTPFARSDLPPGLLDHLAAASAEEGVTLVAVTGGPGLTVLDEQLTAAGQRVATDAASGAGLRAPWSGADAGTGRLEVLATPGDTASDRLRAGQSLQRLLLTAATGWVEARFFTLALEDPLARDRVRSEVCGGGYPQVVLEFGDTSPPAS